MKNFFITVLICLLFSSCTTIYQPRDEISFAPSVFSYTINTTRLSISGERATETTTEYLIYFGNEETAKEQNRNEKAGIMVKFTFLHPVLAAESSIINSYRISKKDDHRWYIIFLNSIKKFMMSGSLFDDSPEYGVWLHIPQLIKHILVAFYKDADLVVIIYDYATETTSLIFHPDHAEDKVYHERKYNKLVGYLNSIKDFNAEINLSDF